MSCQFGPVLATVELIAAISRKMQVSTGTLIFTVSERRLVKFEAISYLRLCGGDGGWTLAARDHHPAIDVAADYLDKLQNLIVDVVGPYGHLSATIEKHEVTELGIHIRLRAGGRRRSRSKRAGTRSMPGA